jgi:hypothetical protein
MMAPTSGIYELGCRKAIGERGSCDADIADPVSEDWRRWPVMSDQSHKRAVATPQRYALPGHWTQLDGFRTGAENE